MQIAEGLAKAHAAGIVHRDLKPENVMVSKDGYVKILDFGLAKLVGARIERALGHADDCARPETHPGTVLGTVGYMSPEQASGQRLDFRSDQFSFGSILYEMVSGQSAFSKKTAARDDVGHHPRGARASGQARAGGPPPRRWIIERCLAKDPEERYASTSDLARELAERPGSHFRGRPRIGGADSRRRPEQTSKAARSAPDCRGPGGRRRRRPRRPESLEESAERRPPRFTG